MLISESQKEKDNSTVFSIVAEKSWPRMESKDYIKVSVFQFLVSSLTELSILGKFLINFRGYDAGKRFIWGNEQ